MEQRVKTEEDGEARRMEKNIVSQCRAGNTKKTPRGRFPKCLLDKVGSPSQWLPRAFIYFITFQKEKYTQKLRGDLDMKPCQFISRSLTPTIFLVTSSFRITWVIRFLLRLKRSLDPTSQLHQTPWLYWFLHEHVHWWSYSAFPTQSLLQNCFLYSCLGSTLSLCNIIYILHSNAWSKDSHMVQTKTELVTLSIFLDVIAYQDWGLLHLPDLGNAGKFPQLSNSELHRLLKFLQISSFSL